MTLKRRILLIAACTLAAQGAFAQAGYPAKPIHFIVPFQAGGESDIVARQIANKLIALRGYHVIVDNYPGAGGNLGAEKALREPADGYTFLVISGAYAGNSIVSKPSFDPIGAIQPVIQFTRQESVLVASTKFKTLGELIGTAKKGPGTVNYGSAGVGSLGHLSTENFAYHAGVKLNHIPYKGTSGAISDLAGGQTDMMMAGLTGARALAKTGQIRILAVGGTKRLADLPDVPTFAESGLPKFETNLWHGLVASKEVPAAIITRINSDINAVLRDPEIVARYSSENVAAIGGTPAEFKETIRSDMERLRFIVKAADIKIQ
jgi:tripartite-type tricarboxylate transporter receptor subunit TctC